MKIIVMGGSFNPPTIAHYHLMHNAIRAVGAEKGIFVPVSHAYLKRKMRKSEAPVCLSQETRLEMLRAMCAGESGWEISENEMQDPMMYTDGTMDMLQTRYPGAELYFLVGADKMDLIYKWAKGGTFLERFRVAMVCRDGVDPMELISRDEILARFRSSFVMVPQPAGLEEVSSTAIRRHFLAGDLEPVRELLHERVWELFSRQDPEDYPPEIERFRGEYEFLSNSYIAPFEYEGLIFLCAEAALQAMRSKRSADWNRFLQCDGGVAKTIASKVEPREDWEAVREGIMESILREKFRQYPDLREKLVNTGNSILVFGGSGKEPFWGMDLYTCQGENRLGKLLMKLRSTDQEGK